VAQVPVPPLAEAALPQVPDPAVLALLLDLVVVDLADLVVEARLLDLLSRRSF
jgi:hypothetical protein